MTRKICVAVDNSETSKYALTWTITNIYKPEASDIIYILHSVQMQAVSPFYSSLDASGTSADLLISMREREMEEGRNILKDYGVFCDQKNVKFLLELTVGDPRHTICEFVESQNIDLLVLGNRGSGLLKRIILGSVSDYCLNHAECPVLCVKQQISQGKEPNE
ncbi:uncharacterized protein LOC135120256 [Zophobas morio]|uniref:uncharacterized protein LOC135120256 n=1 Tax=Zophobas morio TaxID=2755281 RepID=UPI003082C015